MSSQRLKIAIIHPSVGVVQGGSETFVIDLAAQLDGCFETSVLCEKKVNELCVPLPLINRHTARTSSHFLIRMLYKLLHLKASNPDIAFEYISSIPAIVLHLLLNNYDVLYPHNHWGGLFACSIIRKIKKTPILYTEHNSENSKSYLRHLKFKPDCYIAHTKYFYNKVKDFNKNINVKYIPNGINLRKFASFPRSNQSSVFLSGPIILAVGEFIERKRLDLVIEAVAGLSDVCLLLISFGSNLEKLRFMGTSKLGPKRFQLLSDIHHDQMVGYYNLCNVFTLPSPKESFGLVYLEAMACNKPIVTQNDETRQEIIGDAGILCNVEDSNDYGTAILTALNKDWGDKPLMQARKFNWDLVAKEYVDEINNLVKLH